FADTYNFVVRKVSGGIISTVAGNGVPGFAGDGGPAVSAKLNQVFGVAVGPDGSIYISDEGNHRVRKGEGSSVCGNGSVEPGEQCGDHNTTNLDGCSSTCRIEAQMVSQSASAGETVSLAGGAAPTASKPVGAGVTTPTAGTVSISETSTPPGL